MFVQVYKEGKIPHYDWHTREIYRDREGVICLNRGPRSLNHRTRGRVFTFPGDALEFYWIDRPFSLHVDLNRETEYLHYYANIHDLPEIKSDRISFTDYDLDVVRKDTAPAEIIDQDEFELHQELYDYPENVRRTVPEAAEQMRRLLDSSPLFSKEILLDVFSRLDGEDLSFLSRWTGILKES